MSKRVPLLNHISHFLSAFFFANSRALFSYNGHGNGSQFMSNDKIQNLAVNAVVALFGCGSVKYKSFGPKVEMFGSHQMYLIACR